MSSTLPYFLYYGNAKEPLRILVDTGSNKNYIHPKYAKISHDLEKPFFISTVAGDVKITKYLQARLLKPYSDRMIKFFHLEQLKSFDVILGWDSLKENGSWINTVQDTLIVNGKYTIPLVLYKLQEVNQINIRDEHLQTQEKNDLRNMLHNFQDIFQPPDKKLPFTTKVKAEIRTIDQSPVYSKTYPYPQELKSEVHSQINKLLNDGIMRPSRSPYNSPVWIVPKKLDASNEKKYRLVIDYRKINSKTISDRYPIPDTASVLANLGSNKYFTTLDLASGFHQIPMRHRKNCVFN